MKYVCLIFVPKDQQTQHAIRFLEQFGKCGQVSKHLPREEVSFETPTSNPSRYLCGRLLGFTDVLFTLRTAMFFVYLENSRCDVNFHQVKAAKSAVSSGPKAPSVFQDYRFLWTFSRGAISRSRPESSGQVPVPGVLRICFANLLVLRGQFFFNPNWIHGTGYICLHFTIKINRSCR